MKNRLDALLHQRDLAREQLAWIEEEIAQERARHAAALPPAAPRPDTATPAAPPPAAPAAGADAAVLPEADISGLHAEVRRGCLLYFLVAAGGLGALIAFIYWKYGAA